MKNTFSLLVLSLISTSAFAGPQFECFDNGKPAGWIQTTYETVYWYSQGTDRPQYGREIDDKPGVYRFRDKPADQWLDWTLSTNADLLKEPPTSFKAAIAFRKDEVYETTSNLECVKVVATPARPDSVQCVVEKPGRILPKSFEITELNSNDPDSTIEDTGLIDMLNEFQIRKTGKVQMTFTNECDNGYDVELPVQGLADLKAGKVKFVTGTIDGGSAATSGKTIKRKITCK